MNPQIIFFAPYLSPEDSSAAAIRCGFLSQELKKVGTEVELWAPNAQASQKKFIIKPPSNKKGYIHRMLKEALLGLELSLKILAVRLRGHKPLFLFSSPPYITCLIAGFTCRLLGLRYVLDIRDPYPEVYFTQNLFTETSPMGRLQKYLAQSFYNHSTHIFTVTEGCQKMIAGYAVEPGKITVIRNGYDSDLFQAAVPKRPRFTCLFHGNLGRMQNIRLLRNLIEAMAVKNPDIQFLIAGGGPQETLISSLKTSNFQFLGELSHKEIPALLLSCHLGLSFRIEGEYSQIAFPVKVYEYIGAELPTLFAPPSQAMVELTDKKIGFAYQSDQISEMTEKIIELATRQDFYSQTIAAVRSEKKFYSRQFSSGRFSDEVKRLIFAQHGQNELISQDPVEP